jgi:hypothetical protein
MFRQPENSVVDGVAKPSEPAIGVKLLPNTSVRNCGVSKNIDCTLVAPLISQSDKSRNDKLFAPKNI